MDSEYFLSLAQFVTSWLAPFLPYLIKGATLTGEKWFEALGEKGGEEAVKRAFNLWDSIKRRTADNKSVEGAALLLSEDPGNSDVQQLLVKTLTEVFQKNTELLQELEAFRKNTPSITLDQRSGGVYFSNSGRIDIEGDVIGRDQTKNVR